MEWARGNDGMEVYHGHQLWVVWLRGCCDVQQLTGKSCAHRQQILPCVNRYVLQVGCHTKIENITSIE